MRFRLTFILSALLLTTALRAQTSFPRDTSFTLEATFKKEKKYRPYITIASAKIDQPISEKMNLTYKTIGERKLQLDLFAPAANLNHKRYPGILLIHGGGWSSGDKSQMHTLAKEFASRGFVCYTVAYRMTLEAPYPAAVLDLKDAVNWIKEHGIEHGLDNTKIISLGVSAGGQLAALLGTTNGKETFAGKRVNSPQTSTVQAVVNIDGVLAFNHSESSEGKSASAWLLGSYSENPKNWDEASALSHVSAASAPALFINSSLPRFHAGRDDMITKLNTYGVYSQVHEFPDSPHPFWFFNPWYDPMIDLIDTFLKQVFK